MTTPGGASRVAVPDATETDALRARAPRAARELTDRALVAMTAAVTLPILWMGYGTDIDVTDVLASADSIRAGDYTPSRPPGVPVFEAVAAVLDPVGGHLLLNLATAAGGAATVVGIARLVRGWGHPNGDLIALAFLASPIAVISSTSTADFIWAMTFFVWGCLVHLRGRSVPAGVLLALAIGARLPSVLLVVALLVADGWDAAHRRRCVRTALVALPLGALLYVPSWLAYDRSTGFLDPAEGWRSFGNNLGRFLYKGYVTAGGLAIVLIAMAVPALVAALPRWRTDPMLRLGVLGCAAAGALYFVYPWKFSHLLPAVAMLLLWLGASRGNRRPFLVALIVALAVNGVVTFRPLAPDRPAEASTGEWDPAVTPGLLLNDIACRLDAMDEPPQPLNRGAWACSLKPMRGDLPEPEPTGDR
ncbi:MAG TPA: hypothetical protein VF015_12995 [Acidimicrobiales bacterium]